MSGKWILNTMFVVCLVMVSIFYLFLKRSPDYKNLVTQQMSHEFSDYAHQVKHTDELTVAEINGENFVVSTQEPWNFEIQDTVLVVMLPLPVGAKSRMPLPVAASPQAKKAIQDFLWSWVDEKFHSRKDLQMQVQFKSSLPPQ